MDGELWLPDPGQFGSGAELGRGALANNGITISMDGKSAWRDNVFVERLWRSIKYEEVYLRAYDSASHARASLGHYLDFYNGRRPHSSLDGMTPDQAYGSRPSNVRRRLSYPRRIPTSRRVIKSWQCNGANWLRRLRSSTSAFKKKLILIV